MRICLGEFMKAIYFAVEVSVGAGAAAGRSGGVGRGMASGLAVSPLIRSGSPGRVFGPTGRSSEVADIAVTLLGAHYFWSIGAGASSTACGAVTVGRTGRTVALGGMVRPERPCSPGASVITTIPSVLSSGKSSLNLVLDMAQEV